MSNLDVTDRREWFISNKNQMGHILFTVRFCIMQQCSFKDIAIASYIEMEQKGMFFSS